MNIAPPSTRGARLDPLRTEIVIEGLTITDQQVLAEACCWSEGHRGPAKPIEDVAGADLSAFVRQSLAVGARAITGAGTLQETVAPQSLVAEVGNRTVASTQEAAASTRSPVRLSAIAAAGRHGTDLQTAAAKVGEAIAAVERINEITKLARIIKRNAGTGQTQTEALQGDLARLLAAAQRALTAAASDAAAAGPDVDPGAAAELASTRAEPAA